MKKKKVKFIGFWPGFKQHDNFILDILKERYDVEISDDPDYLFVSVFEHPRYSYTKYNCVKIFYTGEPFSPDFVNFDYAVGYDDIKYYDRYCHFPTPIIGLYRKDKFAAKTREEAEEILKNKEYFCNFIYGHATVEGSREAILEKLQQYKRVEIAGKFMNNMPDGKVIPFNEEKLDFVNKCKFTISCESMSRPGFTTEKIMQAFEGNSIPVYFGDPDIAKVYNTKAFVNLMEYDSLDDALERIREIDNNDEEYIKMLMEPKLLNENYYSEKYNEFKAFLYNILDQDKEIAYRRVRDYSGRVYAEYLSDMVTARESVAGILYLKLKNNKQLYSALRFVHSIFRKITGKS